MASKTTNYVDYMKLSQNTTNEIWSVILKTPYSTPGAMKRAIEQEIRGAIETVLGLPSTVDGHEDGMDPLYGELSDTPLSNPYGG